MTYLPPVNGGRINASIGGNTAGAGALVSSGTLNLMGGNNVTLSQNANSITISAGAAGGSNTFGMSNIGNTSGTTGAVSGSAVRFLFAGGNNVTLSQSLNASSGTITISAANQTVQTQNMVSVNGSTGNISFANANNVTFGVNASTITGSASFNQSNQTVGLYGLGNTTQNSSTTLDARTLSFNGLGGATVGYSNGSIQISAPQTVAQTNQTLGLFATGNTTQNSSTTLDARSLTFQGTGGASIGYSNGSIVISGATGGGGGGVAVGNSQAIFTSGSVYLSENGGAITISTASNAGSKSLNFSVPQTSSLSGTGVISISTNGGTISIGAPTQTNQTMNLYGTGNTTQNTSQNMDARTMYFAASGPLSVGMTNGTMFFSAPNQVASTTLSRFEYPEGLFTSLSVAGQSSLSINHMYIPFYVAGSAAKIGGSITVGTSTAAATGSINLSLWMGIYTLNGSTLSLASSGSANNGFSWQAASSASTNLTGITGMRQLTVPMSVNVTPGEYWMAAVIASATTATSVTFNVYGNAQVVAAGSSAILTPIGSSITAARDVMLFQGIYTAQTTAGPATIVGAGINNSAASNVMRANFYNAIYNATY